MVMSGGAKLRYHMCMTCNHIARISIFGTSESTNHLIPETPARHYSDCQPQRCKTCTTYSAVDYSLMYNLIPVSLSRSIRLSFKARRFITVDCEGMLHGYSDVQIDLLASRLQHAYAPNTVVNAKHMRHLIFGGGY